jgi:hypothetical protein
LVVQAQRVDSTKSAVFIEYNFIDLPFQLYAGKTVNSTIANPDASVSYFKGMQYQSMEQGTQIVNSLVTSMNWGIKQIPVFRKKPWLQNITHATLASIVNLYSRNVYDYNSWLHEEFHRSAMVVNYTGSYNPFNLFNKKEQSFGGSVAYVLDTNLVMIKEHHISSFIRMHTAGAEGHIYSVENLQRQNFFHNQKLHLSVNYILNFQDVINYLLICTNKVSSTEITEGLLESDGSRQEVRDFTGLDFNAWAYDLWKPNEPYRERGLNPYGNGYDRYIKGTDLTDEQLGWLMKQYKLSKLNLLSPMNLFISSIRIKKLADGSYLRANFSFRYYPTSFGNQLGLDLLVKYKKWNLYASPHLNQNLNNSFPGLEFAVVDYPIKYRNKDFVASIYATTDLQPKSDGFLSDHYRFVGSLKSTLKWQFNKWFYTSLYVSAKTKGWIKGNPVMENNVGASMGLGFMLQNK